MFKLAALISLLGVGLTVWCVVEAVAADGARVRRLPKPVWIALILLVPFIGPTAWLVVGRPSWAKERAEAAADFAEFERPGRLDLRGEPEASEPERDAAYRRLLRQRAEEQRRRYQQQKDEQGGPEPQ